MFCDPEQILAMLKVVHLPNPGGPAAIEVCEDGVDGHYDLNAVSDDKTNREVRLITDGRARCCGESCTVVQVEGARFVMRLLVTTNRRTRQVSTSLSRLYLDPTYTDTEFTPVAFVAQDTEERIEEAGFRVYNSVDLPRYQQAS